MFLFPKKDMSPWTGCSNEEEKVMGRTQSFFAFSFRVYSQLYTQASLLVVLKNYRELGMKPKLAACMKTPFWLYPIAQPSGSQVLIFILWAPEQSKRKHVLGPREFFISRSDGSESSYVDLSNLACLTRETPFSVTLHSPSEQAQRKTHFYLGYLEHTCTCWGPNVLKLWSPLLPCPLQQDCHLRVFL